MKRLIGNLCAVSLWVVMAVAGQAQAQGATSDPEAGNASIHEERNCTKLLEMLDSGASAEDVVRATLATGMTLAEATVYAMVCGGDSNRVAIAVAGVKLATSLAQAQAVANAVIVTAGQNSDVAAAVRNAVIEVAKHLPQPGVYQDEYTPTGTDVSPAS